MVYQDSDLPMTRHLPSGRVVFDTGRVQVGIRYDRPSRDPGHDAEEIQTLLLRKDVTATGHAWVIGVSVAGLLGLLLAIYAGWLQ